VWPLCPIIILHKQVFAVSSAIFGQSISSHNMAWPSNVNGKEVYNFLPEGKAFKFYRVLSLSTPEFCVIEGGSRSMT